MIRTIKGASLALLFSALFVTAARAQCTGSSPTWTSTPDEASVSSCVSQASPGDTINVTAGSGSVTWTSQLAITTPIQIIGPGSSSLTIVDNAGNSAEMIHWSGTYGSSGCASSNSLCFRLSGMTFAPDSSSTSLFSPIGLLGSCTASGCPNIRVDHMVFNGFTESGNGVQDAWLIRTDNVFGVVDHNQMTTSDNQMLLANVNHSAYLGTGTYGDNSWAQADSFGTANALFFENNTLSSGAMEDCDAGPTGGGVMGGCRIVVRYNTFSSAYIGGAAYFHGTESGQRNRGGRQVEFYQNSVTCTTACDAAEMTMRSGAGLFFLNTVTAPSGDGFNSLVKLYDYRISYNFTPWGVCDGTGSYDDNDGTTYASGTYNGSGGVMSPLTDTTKDWTTNQWVDNGAPYSAHDVTAKWGSEITANTATTATLASTTFGSPVWTSGDSYQLLRATICIDQPGRGAGTYLSGSTPSPTGWVNEALDPIYEWDDSVSGSMWQGTVSSDTARIIANRDFYYANASFNGTSGTGYGTHADMPSTCTPQVAYWATDQNELYQCTATNTWTAFYTPYTYPHPLIGPATAPAPPTNVVATPH